MIKILINNEEVVSNSNLQIKEEMLSTSSTILKNCYPKTWEDDKDYVSRYYFPKDYAKCKILDVEEIDYEILGETTQEGTPTPDNPIPIISKTGTITETIYGKEYTFNLGNIELNNIGTYQDSIKKSTGKNLFDKNNANVLNAYMNWQGVITSSSADKLIYIPCKPNTTYTLQKGLEATSSNNRFRVGTTTEVPNYNMATNDYYNAGDGSTTKQYTFTTSANANYLVFYCYRNDTITTFEKILDTIQIEENSQATPYEPYLQKGTWYIEKSTRKLELAIADMNNSENYPGWKNVPYLNGDYPNKNTQMSATGISYYTNIVKQPTGYDAVSLNTNSGNSTLYLARGYWGNSYTQTYWQSNYPDLVFEIIYTLDYPEYTEITDTTLLEQLNNVGKKLLFCGCVKNTGKISLNPREPHYVDLQILDFKTLLSEGETLNYVITGKTIPEAINMVVSSISDYGFVVGNINIQNPNDIINAYSTLDKTAYDVFQYIAEITQSRWSTRMIDENIVAIDFFDPLLEPITKTINSTETYYCNNNIVDISFSYSTNDYRNKQIMTSEEVYANITQAETKIADGYSKNFICDNKIGTILSIKVNGIEATFMTKAQQNLGYSADFVYQPGENTFISTNTLSAGSVIIISYYPIVRGREIVLNSAETSRISSQINRKGIISRYENRNDATNSAELQKIGQSYIKYKGTAEITIKVVSKNDLFNVGEIINYDSLISELDNNYMVKSKETNMYLNAGEIFYTYELTSNFNSENAINYFDNQRAKANGNLGDGETIVRNIDLENTAVILFYDTNIEEIQVQNPTSLDFTLDGVLI